MPFNDEGLARAVAACPVPVVTGIGHEPDNSICDMVADLRCSTPTAAAENSAPSVDEIAARLGTCGSRLAAAFGAQMQTAAHRVDACRTRPVFSDAHALLGMREQGIDVLGDRLFAALPGMMDVRAQRTAAADQRLRAIGPRLAQGQRQRVDATADRLRRAAGLVGTRQAAQVESASARLVREGGALLDRPQAQITTYAQALESLSPLAVLARGYAVARDDEGRLVRRVSDVSSGDGLHVEVGDGVIDARVL